MQKCIQYVYNVYNILEIYQNKHIPEVTNSGLTNIRVIGKCIWNEVGINKNSVKAEIKQNNKHVKAMQSGVLNFSDHFMCTITPGEELHVSSIFTN